MTNEEAVRKLQNWWATYTRTYYTPEHADDTVKRDMEIASILTALSAGEGTIRYACALLQGHAVRSGRRVWIDGENWDAFCAVLSAPTPPAREDVPPAMRRLVAIVSDLDARGEVEPIVVDGVRAVVREHLTTPASAPEEDKP